MRNFFIIVVLLLMVTNVKAYISAKQKVKFDSYPFECSVRSAKHRDTIYFKVSKSSKDKMYLIMDDGVSHGVLSGSFTVILYRDWSNDNYYGEAFGKEYNFQKHYNYLDGAKMVLNGNEKVVIDQTLCIILTQKEWVLTTGIRD